LAGSATTYEPNTFISFAQAAINAIRAVDASTPIQVGGAGNANAVAWQVFNYELSTLTGTGLVFDAHQYFDGASGSGGPGTYTGDYSSYSGLTSSSGVTEVQPFLDWLTATSKTGFLGEFGVPNKTTDNNAAWLPLQLAVVNALKAAGVKGTQWFYGSNGIQAANVLNFAAANDARLTQMLAVK
jgi:endoglucanase